MNLIGIGGAIGAGKDVLAEHFVRRHGFERVGFAAVLKDEVARRLRRTLAAHLCQTYGPMVADGGAVVSLATLEESLQDPARGALVDAEIRRRLWVDRDPVTRALLQEYGTEVRRADDPDYWVRAWAARTAGLPRVVAPDVRFPNEASAIRAAGGWLLEVRRPGYERAGHESETAGAGIAWDLALDNDGTTEALIAKVEAVFCPRLSAEEAERERRLAERGEL